MDLEDFGILDTSRPEDAVFEWTVEDFGILDTRKAVDSCNWRLRGILVEAWKTFLPVSIVCFFLSSRVCVT